MSNFTNLVHGKLPKRSR